MTKALLVGSSFSALPILDYLNSLGMDVIVVGKHRQDPCHNKSWKSYYLDYSKEKKLIELVKKEKPNFIIPTCNDYSYSSSTMLGNMFCFPGYDSLEKYELVYHKDVLKEFLQERQYDSPRNYNITDFKSLKYPVIVKPSDSFSGQGIKVANNFSELKEAILNAKTFSRKNNFQIEEFVDGSLHSCSFFLQNNKILNSFFVDEFCKTTNFSVNNSYHPSLLSKKNKEELCKNIDRFQQENCLCDGLLHVQFMLNQKKQVKIIEMMRRCPGDLFPYLIEFSTNFPYWESYVNPFIGKKNKSIEIKQNKYISRHNIDSSISKYTNFISFPQVAKSKIFSTKTSGEFLESAPQEKAGILFQEHKNKQSLYQSNDFSCKIEIF